MNFFSMKQTDFYRLDNMQCYYGNKYIFILHYAQYLVLLYCRLLLRSYLGWKIIKKRKTLIFSKKRVAGLYFIKALWLTNSRCTYSVRVGPFRLGSACSVNASISLLAFVLKAEFIRFCSARLSLKCEWGQRRLESPFTTRKGERDSTRVIRRERRTVSSRATRR